MHSFRRSKPLRRRTPLRRSNKPLRRRTPLRRISVKRAKEIRSYSRIRLEYLLAHPLCQITIAELKLDEKAVVAALERSGGAAGRADWAVAYYYGPAKAWIPFATQIHHRNKRFGPRLLDTRWWMAACADMHRAVDDSILGRKSWARAAGYLLDISADEEGRTPGGGQAFTTEELLARAAG